MRKKIEQNDKKKKVAKTIRSKKAISTKSKKTIIKKTQKTGPKKPENSRKKVTANIAVELLKKAQKASGKNITDTIIQGLENILGFEDYQRRFQVTDNSRFERLASGKKKIVSAFIPTKLFTDAQKATKQTITETLHRAFEEVISIDDSKKIMELRGKIIFDEFYLSQLRKD